MDYARSKGKKSFAAMAPQSDYGNIAVAEFQQAASRLGVRVVTIARYGPGQAASAAKQIAAVAAQVDALFIPEQADGAEGVSAALAASGLKMQILGTGIWNDPRVRVELPAAAGRPGSAALENGGFANFAERYRAKFNSDPVRLATLAYDAVSLACAAPRRTPEGRSAFPPEKVLTNPSGFNGFFDGAFRFRADVAAQIVGSPCCRSAPAVQPASISLGRPRASPKKRLIRSVPLLTSFRPTPAISAHRMPLKPGARSRIRHMRCAPRPPRDASLTANQQAAARSTYATRAPP